MLTTTQKYIHNKKIIIETKKNTYAVPQDMCEIYLNNMKKNLLLLYKSFNKEKCKDLYLYIKETHNELQKFTNSDLEANDADLLRYDIINKLDLLKSDDLKLHKSFINIILDIELILYLIRTSSCSNKRLTLNSMHNLMKSLYMNRCSDTLTYTDLYNNDDVSKVNEMFTNNDELDISGADIIKSTLPNFSKSIHTTQSQDVRYDMNGEEYTNQLETPIYKSEISSGNKIMKKDLVSQNFDCSSDYILSYKSSQPYVPLCDINKLRSERVKLKALTTDLTFNRSLRNDYDHLDD